MSNHSAPNNSVPVVPPVTVFVCTQCGIAHAPATGKPQANPKARALVMAIRQALGGAPNIIVKLSRCLGPCDGPIAYAFLGEGRETLLFTSGGDKADAEVIATAARTYARKRAGTRYQRTDIPLPQRGTIYARVPPAKSKA